MYIFTDDKGPLDVVDLYKVHLSVDVYIQHPISQPEFYDGPLKQGELNPENIANLKEEDFLSKLYEKVVRGTTFKMVRNKMLSM